jgi:hypothetical protein
MRVVAFRKSRWARAVEARRCNPVYDKRLCPGVMRGLRAALLSLIIRATLVRLGRSPEPHKPKQRKPDIVGITGI